MVVAAALAVLVPIISAMTACSDQTGQPGKTAAVKTTNAPLSVYVVNYPLQYFAERIGGSHFAVTFPVPADVDPAFWEPTAEQVGAFQRADLILLNGASYAKWVNQVSLPASRIVDTSASFSDRYILIADQATHSHGASGEHRHGGVAFTTWLDPQLAVEQAAAVRDALIRLRPDVAEELQQNFAGLEKDLRELDQGFSDVFAATAGRRVMFSHPVYQYLIRRYAIDGFAVHWEPDVVPNAGQWQELKRLLSEHPVRSMLWEATPDPATASGLAQRGLQSLVFEPCAIRPAEGDYLSVMQENLNNISAKL
jgi:zinc transport system substrate-binding protein